MRLPIRNVLPIKELDKALEDKRHDVSVVVENGVFVVGNVATEKPNAESARSCSISSEYGFTLKGIDLHLKPRDMLAVVGPVGSGKSTLIKALIGDVVASSNTNISLYGKVAYASQNPFIMNTTVRENIVFGKPFSRSGDHRY